MANNHISSHDVDTCTQTKMKSRKLEGECWIYPSIAPSFLVIFSLLSYQHYYTILTFFFGHWFIYKSQLSIWSWDVSSSFIHGINHTNIYVELAIGLATKYFNRNGVKAILVGQYWNLQNTGHHWRGLQRRQYVSQHFIWIISTYFYFQAVCPSCTRSKSRIHHPSCHCHCCCFY